MLRRLETVTSLLPVEASTAVGNVVLRFAVVATAGADGVVPHHAHESRLGNENHRALDSVPLGSGWVPRLTVDPSGNGLVPVVESRLPTPPPAAPISASPGRLTTDYPRVSIVIPTLNEAANLPHILPLIPSEHEVVVVDGGSTDRTMAVARAVRPDAQVFRQPRHGKAAALFAGFAAAHGDILITLDADGSHDVEELSQFIDALKSGADFVKGSRLIKGGGSADFTWFRAAGTRALGMVANVIHGTNYTDLTYGYNGLWRHALPHLVTVADGFEGEVLMCIRAARAGLRVTEVPCFEAPRVAGVSKLHAGRDGFRVLRAIMKESFASHSPAAGARELTPSSVWSEGNGPRISLEPLRSLDDDLAARAATVVPNSEA